MNKSLGGAAKARERKKIKLEQVAHNCSQNISNMFNAITKKSSKLEPVEPQVILINLLLIGQLDINCPISLILL